MKNQQAMKNLQKGDRLTLTGAALMLLLTATKVAPSSKLAGCSVFVGIAFFFIVEAVSQTPRAESGLRFTTIADDLKKPDALAWALLPGVSGIATLALGNRLFGGAFVAHVMGRTSAILSFDRAALLAGQVIVAALGEEIAYRGFFLGKGMRRFPFGLCALVSSLAFAAGHIAAGSVDVVLYDVATVFLDSLIFSAIYRKTGNCAVSALSHILGNALSLVAVFLLF